MAASVFENLYQEELYILPSRTLVVIDKEWHILPEDQVLLLQKILASVKLSLPAVQIIHTSKVDDTLIRSMNPSRILSFGIEVEDVSSRYQVAAVGPVTIITADSLSAFDDVKKKNLWQALRQMFGL